VPIGVTGELFVGGRGLARSYLNRSMLTSERFIPDPFGGEGGRLYRTGDLVRWREDGVIEYVGRADQQVKIRGFRIEPGEIEARLTGQPGVRSAVVVAHGTGAGRKLVGYVSGQPGLDGVDLRSALSMVLPDHMVPSRIIIVEQMPLTANGKVDRQKLPSPEGDWSGPRVHRPPEGEIEVAIAAMWTDVLGVQRVSRDDHFFELGGHSLLAVRLLSRVSQEFGVSVALSELFAHPQLAEFARSVSIALIEAEFDQDELQDLMVAGQ
jgi:acyl carrier protein